MAEEGKPAADGADVEAGDDDEPWIFMDPYDSHLDARVERDGLTVGCLHEDGFQYLWKGIRSSYGIKKGIFMYEVKVLDNPSVRMPETKPQNQNILRCGFSVPLTSLFLGDTAEGWGWGGTGKKSHNNNFADYGGTFKMGDVIGCIVDTEQGTISFMKNGQFMGVAFDNVPPSVQETGIFPHLLMKNVKCKVNFRRQDKWFDPPGPQVKFLEEADDETCIVNPVDHPESLKEAEFILLAGLPGCGKTYWAQKHMEANPLKNFMLLGTNAVIDQMKVMGVGRQRNYADRWQELISQATPIFNKLVEIAGKTPRNFILDQTNVYKNARQRKAAAFKDFGKRVCVTIVNDEEQLAYRTDKREREEGKYVPVEAVNQMRSNFACPELEDGFTELEWPELPETDARQMVTQIRAGGGDWARRNPGARGMQAKSRLESRDASTIGKGCGKNWDQKPQGGSKPPGGDRSRSPPGKGGGGGGGKGSW
jgi:heterogeneous nuclear ribonucleoprotein U-like protein 1